jgi:signal transduction histidine kinase
VFKLGEDLITDDVQALVELIKNSYDADSPSVEITIDSNIWVDLRTGVELPGGHEAQSNSSQEPVRGRIIVRDRGVGMTYETIRDGWLTVSASKKGELKLHPERLKGRMPLGDKGLGRLGAQRLGRALTLRTFPRSHGDQPADAGPGYEATLVWDDFLEVDSLSKLPIQILPVAHRATEHGTTIEIRGLRSLQDWSAQGDVLERRLARMMSPYDDIPGFKVRILVDGNSVDLREHTRAIRDKAAVAYSLVYSEQSVRIEASISTLYLQPLTGLDDRLVFDRLVGNDNGHSFLEWLLEHEGARAEEVGLRHGDPERFAHASVTLDLSKAPDFEFREDSAGRRFADPGSFSGEIEQVVLRVNPTSVFDSADAYRDFVSSINGVRIYRNGFGIPLADDWLNLAAQWSSARSYYTLRPENVIGHIDLTVEHNQALVETTNREAFSDTPAYRNFLHIVGEWLSYTERLQSTLRRGFNEYKKSLLASVAEIEPTATPAAIVGRVQAQMTRLEGASTHLEKADQAIAEMDHAAVILNTQRTLLDDQVAADPRLVRIYDEAIAEVGRATTQVRQLISNVRDQAIAFEAERAGLDLLLAQVSIMEQQVRDSWEAVSLGLTAEALSHEAANVTDRLRSQSTQLVAHLRKAKIEDRSVWNFVEQVRGAVASLAKQISRLDPSLRNVRETRRAFSIREFGEGLSDYFDARWAGRNIQLLIDVDIDFTVSMNAGRLTQVFDNLLLNSEYWVETALLSGSIEQGKVRIVISRPFVFVSDNGPGINPAVEASLFDPFVTTKPRTRGRGLGLFVVSQLLDADQISIGLDEERDATGRRHTFRIDFTSVVEGRA